MINDFDSILENNSLEDIVREMFKEQDSYKQDWIIQRLAPRWSDKLLNSTVRMYMKDQQFKYHHTEQVEDNSNWGGGGSVDTAIYQCKFCMKTIPSRDYHKCDEKQDVIATCNSISEFVKECSKLGIRLEKSKL